MAAPTESQFKMYRANVPAEDAVGGAIDTAPWEASHGETVHYPEPNAARCPLEWLFTEAHRAPNRHIMILAANATRARKFCERAENHRLLYTAPTAYNRPDRKLMWANGSVAMVFTSLEKARGYLVHAALVDEGFDDSVLRDVATLQCPAGVVAVRDLLGVVPTAVKSEAEMEALAKRAVQVLRDMHPKMAEATQRLPEFGLRTERPTSTCSTCNTRHLSETCPYCAGHFDGAQEAEGSRRALEFATKQMEMLDGQLAKARENVERLAADRDQLIAHQQLAVRGLMANHQEQIADLARLHEDQMADCARALADLTRQRDLAQQDRDLEFNRRMLAYEALDRMCSDRARLRTWAGRLFLGGVGATGAAALTWLWWDCLRPVAAYLPGTRTWAELAVGLALLLVLRAPCKSSGGRSSTVEPGASPRPLTPEVAGSTPAGPTSLVPDAHVLRCLGCGREAQEGKPCPKCDQPAKNPPCLSIFACEGLMVKGNVCGFGSRKELPGGNPGKLQRPAAPESTGAGPTPRNASSP